MYLELTYKFNGELIELEIHCFDYLFKLPLPYSSYLTQ